jgi:hypothetical protein
MGAVIPPSVIYHLQQSRLGASPGIGSRREHGGHECDEENCCEGDACLRGVGHGWDGARKLSDLLL